MLNGIGGSTVAEAKERITYAEFVDWMTYRKMRGSLFNGNRLESGFALLAWMVNKACGGSAEQKDFMPHADTADNSFAAFVREFNTGRK